ncbi:probable LRR receptor-like serine/threonine-protein kinase At1g56140 isoform X1 [Mangifera indica]|uniref:probable LRR receptor-like serine/threonine-protein kinase At1g56140 isoform X1 n=1 Tax=Mangifera indica TaxID=29780 RepID=UPI001CF9B429|nr:probable LRR receptor-like serine/threonine-protein kinase At1g56140 isoform X1 [Mangifera indica]
MQNNVFIIASNVLGLSCLQRNLAYNKSAPHCKLLLFPVFDFFSIIWRTAIFPFLADSFDTDQSSFPSGYLRNVVINVSMPSDIEEYKSLQTMFLGNNGLSGTIPQQKAVYLKNMYLVTSNISIHPGLNCLQRNFPCNKSATCYSSFAIYCGGEEMKVDSMVYKADNNDIDGASSNLLDAEKGAITDANLFSDRQQQIQHTCSKY